MNKKNSFSKALGVTALAGALVVMSSIRVCADPGITSGTGDVVVPGSPGGNLNCTSGSGSCLVWQTLDTSQLVDAWSNNYYQYYGHEPSQSEIDAYNTCRDAGQETVAAVHVNNSTGVTEFGNVDDFWAQASKQNHETSNFNWSDSMEGAYDETTGDPLSYSDVLNRIENSGTTEADLSIFCAAMVSTPPPPSNPPGTTPPPPPDHPHCPHSSQEVDVPYSATPTGITKTGIQQYSDDYLHDMTHTYTIDQSSPPSGLSKWAPEKWELDFTKDDLKGTHRSGSGWSVTEDNWQWLLLGTEIKSESKLTYPSSATAKRWIERFPQYDDDGNFTGCRDVPKQWFWLKQNYSKQSTQSDKASNPYDFQLSTSSINSPAEISYSGGSATVLGRVQNRADGTKGTNTWSSKHGDPGTILQLIEFVVPPTENSDGTKGYNGGETPCAHYTEALNAYSCNIIQEDRNPLYPGESRLLHADSRRIIPDIYPVGSKYCIATGAFVAGAKATSGMANLASVWTSSGASCSTISKKPNFEVWNSGIFTNGEVNTSVTTKVVGSSYGSYTNGITTIFGSWAEQLAIIGKNANGFASGTTLGYYGDQSFGLSGGIEYDNQVASGRGAKRTSPLTVSNSEPIGNSEININTLANSLIERLKARYPTDPVGDITLGDTNIDSGVKVINSTGTVTISGDICYGERCNLNHDRSTSQELTLAQQSLTTDSISHLPQMIIFAKNINITGNVERIDAWLIAEEGTINTCSGFEDKNTEAGVENGVDTYRWRTFNTSGCNRQLITNGPIFAKKLLLNRTAGSHPGSGTYQSGASVTGQNLSDDGSITPAEIFNLRPDTYLWAYSQAQDFTEAVITYSRELAPRF